MINEDAIADLLPDDDLPETDPTDPEGELGGIPGEPQIGSRSSKIPLLIKVRKEGVGAKGHEGSGGGKQGDVVDQDSHKSNGGRRRKRRGSEGTSGGTATEPATDIELRSYRDATQNETSSYQLIARSSKAYAGDVIIEAVTEEGNTLPCPIEAAYDTTGRSLTVDNNTIKGVDLPEREAVRLKIVLSTPARFALRASVP
nr:Unknown Function [uncultured bacterium]